MTLETTTEKQVINDQNIDFDLQDFFPYLVRVFYTDVTSAVSSSYVDQFDMTPAEWRSMAILGPDNSLTSNEIVVRSSMDKVTVSRAISRMKKNGWIDVSTNVGDGRSRLLSLNDKGKSVYFNLIPKVLDVERQLLVGVTDQQKRQFVRTMAKIRENRAKLKD